MNDETRMLPIVGDPERGLFVPDAEEPSPEESGWSAPYPGADVAIIHGPDHEIRAIELDRRVLGFPVEVECSAVELCESCAVFSALHDAAAVVAPDADQPRLRIAWRLARTTGQHGLAGPRLLWAAHVLTGPVLLRLAPATFGSMPERVDDLDLLTNFVRFCRAPGARSGPATHLAGGRLWRSLHDLLVRCEVGERAAILASAVDLMVSVGGMDAVFGSMMVDLVVGAILPPPVPA